VRDRSRVTAPCAAFPPEHSPLWAIGGAAVECYLDTLTDLLTTAIPAGLCYEMATEIAMSMHGKVR
jgi:hypothetical protein